LDSESTHRHSQQVGKGNKKRGKGNKKRGKENDLAKLYWNFRRIGSTSDFYDRGVEDLQ